MNIASIVKNYIVLKTKGKSYIIPDLAVGKPALHVTDVYSKCVHVTNNQAIIV